MDALNWLENIHADRNMNEERFATEAYKLGWEDA